MLSVFNVRENEGFLVCCFCTTVYDIIILLLCYFTMLSSLFYNWIFSNETKLACNVVYGLNLNLEPITISTQLLCNLRFGRTTPGVLETVLVKQMKCLFNFTWYYMLHNDIIQQVCGGGLIQQNTLFYMLKNIKRGW